MSQWHAPRRRRGSRRGDPEGWADVHAHIQEVADGLHQALGVGLDDMRKDLRGELLAQAGQVRQNREANFTEHQAVQAQIASLATQLGEHVVEDRTGRRVLLWFAGIGVPATTALLIFILNHVWK